MVEGRLTTRTGAPIRGATIVVQERIVDELAATRPPASVTTDEEGRFAYRVAAGPTRDVIATYTAFSADEGPVATARATLKVRAGVTLRTSTSKVRNGTALRFLGRVRGQPRGGPALVTIYALGGGPRKRIPVETVRARSDGRFSYSYRFRSIPGPSVYRFEARVPKQTGFPYLEGASPVVTVRGRP
jgi:hypothetical protein